MLLLALVPEAANSSPCCENSTGPREPIYLYYIAGTGSYYLPGVDADLFFALGRWYRKQGETWSTGPRYDGPWTGILSQSLPADIAALPDDFKTSRNLGQIPFRYVVAPDDKCGQPYSYYPWKRRHGPYRRGPHRDWYRPWYRH